MSLLLALTPSSTVTTSLPAATKVAAETSCAKVTLKTYFSPLFICPALGRRMR